MSKSAELSTMCVIRGCSGKRSVGWLCVTCAAKDSKEEYLGDGSIYCCNSHCACQADPDSKEGWCDPRDGCDQGSSAGQFGCSHPRAKHTFKKPHPKSIQAKLDEEVAKNKKLKEQLQCREDEVAKANAEVLQKTDLIEKQGLRLKALSEQSLSSNNNNNRSSGVMNPTSATAASAGEGGESVDVLKERVKQLEKQLASALADKERLMQKLCS